MARDAWYIGDRNELGGDLVIASVQKLSRPDGLERIAQEHFDYVIVDEVHHAHAPSYRRVLSKIQSDFILGLTATPERTDGYDVVSIFDDTPGLSCDHWRWHHGRVAGAVSLRWHQGYRRLPANTLEERSV